MSFGLDSIQLTMNTMAIWNGTIKPVQTKVDICGSLYAIKQTKKPTKQTNQKKKPSFNDLPWIVPFPTKIMLEGGEQTANVTQDPEQS